MMGLENRASRNSAATTRLVNPVRPPCSTAMVRNVVTPARTSVRAVVWFSARRKARSSMRQRCAGVPRYFFGGFQNWSTSGTTSNTVFWSLPSLRSTLRR